jgi:hypothetical protein
MHPDKNLVKICQIVGGVEADRKNRKNLKV